MTPDAAVHGSLEANQQWARVLPQPQPTVLRLAQVPEAGMMRPQ